MSLARSNVAPDSTSIATVDPKGTSAEDTLSVAMAGTFALHVVEGEIETDGTRLGAGSGALVAGNGETVLKGEGKIYRTWTLH